MAQSISEYKKQYFSELGLNSVHGYNHDWSLLVQGHHYMVSVCRGSVI